MPDRIEMPPEGVMYGVGSILAVIGSGVSIVYRVFIGKPLKRIEASLKANAKALADHENDEIERMEKHEHDQTDALRAVHKTTYDLDRRVVTVEADMANMRREFTEV